MTRTTIKLLLDEHIWKGLTQALKERGYDALSIVDIDRGADDEPLLELAGSQGRAVLTFNVRDFVPLAQLWYESGRNHAGIVLSHEIPYPELLRRTVTLLQTVSAKELHNTVRRLEEFR